MNKCNLKNSQPANTTNSRKSFDCWKIKKKLPGTEFIGLYHSEIDDWQVMIADIVDYQQELLGDIGLVRGTGGKKTN